MAAVRWWPPNGGIRCIAGGVGTHDSQPISGYRIEDCCSTNNNCDGDRAVYRTDSYASVNLCLSQPAWTTTTKRREKNSSVCSGKTEAEVDCARRFVLMKLTSDRHEASHGLFTTAELLVIECTVNIDISFTDVCPRQHHEREVLTYRHECVVQSLRPIYWRKVSKSRPVY